jgi:hypothetical protein
MSFEIGMLVWTHTQSGQPIECTIIGFEDGEVLLDSPAHGYIIRRHESEISVPPLEAITNIKRHLEGGQ